MSNPINPNYKKGVGRLVTDRFDFQDHVDGYNFKHKANSINLSPSVTINSINTNNVQQAIETLTAYVSPPTILVQDANTFTKGILKLNGDLGGTADFPKVLKIQGYNVSNQAPTLNEVLTWNGAAWEPQPTSSSSSFVASNDLAGDNSSQTVIGIQGRPVLNTLPTNNQILQWSGTNARWEPKSINIPSTPSGTGFVTVTSGVNDSTATINIRYTGGKLQTDANIQWKNGSITGDLIWSPSSTNKTLTLPDATDTLVGRATTDTLTNKTINATNNTITDTGIVSGDILVSNGTKFVRTAKGSDGTFLGVQSGTVGYYTISSGTDTLQRSNGSGGFTSCTNLVSGNSFISFTDSVMTGSISTTGSLRFGQLTGSDGYNTHSIIVARDNTGTNRNLLSYSSGSVTMGDTNFNVVLSGDSSASIKAAGNGLYIIENSGNTGSYANFFGTVSSISSGGINYISIANSSTVPTGTPSGGGYLYVDSGALKFMGTSGTLTTVAPAEPHCKKCGRDFMHEWQNEQYGSLSTCVPCLLDALEVIGINVNDFSDRKLNP